MKRLLITCTEEEEQAFFELSRRYKVSAALLGQHAIQLLLSTSGEGVRPMLKPSKKTIPTPENHGYFNWIDPA